MDSQGAKWEPISGEDVKKWRKRLPEGHIRETNTAYSLGMDPTESDGDEAVFEKPATPVVDDPRRVVNDLKKQILDWVTANRENAKLSVQIMRNSNPEAFRHRTDEDLIGMLVGHMEEKIQQATESVYRDPQNKWDKGKLVDIKDGIWRP